MVLKKLPSNTMILDLTYLDYKFTKILSSFFEARYMYSDLISKVIHSYIYKDESGLVESWEYPRDEERYNELIHELKHVIYRSLEKLSLMPNDIINYNVELTGIIILETLK